MDKRQAHVWVTSLLLVLTLAMMSCSSHHAGTSAGPGSATTGIPSPPTGLTVGDLFTTTGAPSFQARYSRTVDARGKSTLRIAIVGIDGAPAFNPSIVEVDPGQVLTVTIYQSGGLSAKYVHNFSIDGLRIDKDILQGKGESVTVKVTVPESGALTFYCRLHAESEQHAGEFLVGQ